MSIVQFSIYAAAARQHSLFFSLSLSHHTLKWAIRSGHIGALKSAKDEMALWGPNAVNSSCFLEYEMVHSES